MMRFCKGQVLPLANRIDGPEQLQPFTSPDPVHSILPRTWTRAPQQHRDPPLPIPLILSSQDLFLLNFTKSTCLLCELGDMLVTSRAWRK
jgi:hypothetical protein